MLTIFRQDGTHTGVRYASDEPRFRRHHQEKGEVCVWTADSYSKGDIYPDYGTAEWQHIVTSSTTKVFEMAVEEHMNDVCAAKGYGTARTEPVISACTYAGYANPYQDEALAVVSWRADVWAHVNTVLNDVLAGNRDMPTEAELLVELPEIVWP